MSHSLGFESAVDGRVEFSDVQSLSNTKVGHFVVPANDGSSEAILTLSHMLKNRRRAVGIVFFDAEVELSYCAPDVG